MDELGLLNIVLTILASALLYYLAVSKRVLDLAGGALAFVMGLVVGILGHWTWLGLLLLFVVLSYLATRHRYEEKVALDVAQSHGGRRGMENVIANGYVPVVVAALSFPYPPPLPSLPKGLGALMFVTAIAVATSDTLASELGVFDRRTVWVWAPWRRAPVGANGGVSPIGQGAAAFGAAAIAAAAFVALPLFDGALVRTLPAYVLVCVLGFVGCQLDSVLGAAFENRGWMNGSWVNLLSIFAMTLMAYLLGWLYPTALFLAG